ncbi:hypothetical protein [Butyrivibrio sp. MB2005]|uniref:hypothetical protein n=1 Tax=Butyrivibrio sp. MB2005 TaxID=1280678 RepID=UPI0004120B2C|nr:hypothetical protein [Butyrivibrio sp. MB2005]
MANNNNFDDHSKLISDLEYIVAKHCSTKGLNYGNEYRYPVNYTKDGVNYIAKKYAKAEIDYNSIGTMTYEFGAHSLEIGKALEEIVDFLCEEYDIYLP